VETCFLTRHTVRLLLRVTYPDSYPDVLPELSLDVLEGTLNDQESDELISELNTISEENIGMAMTFTLISHIRERLLVLLQSRVEQKRREAVEKERLEIEVCFRFLIILVLHSKAPQAEEARTRGTPVTPEAFLSWKSKFDKEMAARRVVEQEERLKVLPAKDRDELRKIGTRLTGSHPSVNRGLIMSQ
jgi:RWD domain